MLNPGSPSVPSCNQKIGLRWWFASRAYSLRCTLAFGNCERSLKLWRILGGYRCSIVGALIWSKPSISPRSNPIRFSVWKHPHRCDVCAKSGHFSRSVFRLGMAHIFKKSATFCRAPATVSWWRRRLSIQSCKFCQISSWMTSGIKDCKFLTAFVFTCCTYVGMNTHPREMKNCSSRETKCRRSCKYPTETLNLEKTLWYWDGG